MIVDQIEPLLGEVVIVSYEGGFHPDNQTYHGHASVALDNTCKYDGQFRNGMFHGRGIFQWPDGVKFDGDFEFGRISGRGTYEWPDGSIYQGEVLDGLRHGNGKFVGGSGQTYEGEWLLGKRHGKGKLWYNEEHTSSFTGDWAANLRHGYGTMKYPSGNFYEGEWRDDKKSGSGLMVWRDVDEIYTGQWLNDLPHGLGEHIWGDSSSHTVKKETCNIYRGHFVAGRREGHGAFFYMNGSQYHGEWVADAKEGEGLFLYADGRVFGGLFRQNRMVTEYSREEAGAPRATEAVNPQFRLNIAALFDRYPHLLPAASSSPGLSPAARSAVAPVSISSAIRKSAGPAGGREETVRREVCEMERLLLKYNHYLRGALRRYTDFANKRRLRDALWQHQLLAAWAPSEAASRANKACTTARIFQKRLFCMNLEQMVRFLRECGVVGPFFRSYDLSQCLLQLRQETAELCVDKLREYLTQMRLSEQAPSPLSPSVPVASAQDCSAEAKAAQSDDAETETETETEAGGRRQGAASGESAEDLRRLLSLDLTPLMDPYLHPSSGDPAFSVLAMQPLCEREFVELFVRALAVKQARTRGLGANYSEEMGKVSDMSLTQLLYYELAHKLLPLVTDFDGRTPSFYRDFYYEEVQTLLLSDEGRHGAGDTVAAGPAAVSGKQSLAAQADLSGKEDSHGSAGTAEPTCMEKLWAHLRSLASDPVVPAGQRSAGQVVCGTPLPAMHRSGPPALAVNRTGGSVRLRVLVDCLLALRGTAVASDATALSLLLAMECAVPSNFSAGPAHSRSQHAADAEAATEPAAPATATIARPEDFDLTCLDMRVDFLDFLELLCRVVGSPLWAYRSPASTTGLSGVLPSSVGAGAEEGNKQGGEGGSVQDQDQLAELQSSHMRDPEQEQDQDSVSVYSVHLSDVLAERLAVWKQTFNFDDIQSYQYTASEAAQAEGDAPPSEHQQ